MKKTTTIYQEWWPNEGNNDIPFTHQNNLEDEGLRRAIEMIKDSYTSGELHFVEEDGTNYNGFWNMTTETK